MGEDSVDMGDNNAKTGIIERFPIPDTMWGK